MKPTFIHWLKLVDWCTFVQLSMRPCHHWSILGMHSDLWAWISSSRFNPFFQAISKGISILWRSGVFVIADWDTLVKLPITSEMCTTWMLFAAEIGNATSPLLPSPLARFCSCKLRTASLHSHSAKPWTRYLKAIFHLSTFKLFRQVQAPYVRLAASWWENSHHAIMMWQTEW